MVAHLPNNKVRFCLGCGAGWQPAAEWYSACLPLRLWWGMLLLARLGARSGAKRAVSRLTPGVLLKIEGGRQGAVQFLGFLVVQPADEVREHGFRQAHEFVAVNAGIPLEALCNPNLDLSAERVVPRIDRRADQRGESRVDQRLAAYHNEYALALGILRSRLPDQVKLAASHGKP